MNDLQHQHIVARLNFRSIVESENKIIDEMERRAKPLFISLGIVAMAIILELVYTDRMEFNHVKTENAKMSAAIARCANGEIVQMGDGLMTCKMNYLVKGL